MSLLKVHFYDSRELIEMAPKEGPHRPSKRTAPAELPDSGYEGERREWRDARSEIEREVETLRLKN